MHNGLADYLANVALKTKKDASLEDLGLDYWYIRCRPPCDVWTGYAIDQDWSSLVEEDGHPVMKR